MQVDWRKNRKGKVAVIAGALVTVRRRKCPKGPKFSAHYGPDLWVIGQRFKTEAAAQKAAVSYAIAARTSHAGPTVH